MLTFRVFFFILSSCAASSIVLAQEARFHKEVNPVGSTYIYAVLENARVLAPQSRALPYGASTFIKRLEVNIDHIKSSGVVDVHLPFPWMIVNAGLNIKDIFCFIGHVEDTIEETLRGNLIFGNLYTHPVFLRVGYDYIPFGRHVSQAIAAQNIITQTGLNGREVLISVGGNYEMSQGQVRGSVTYFVPVISKRINLVANIQYEQDQPISLFDFGTIARFIAGGGVGAGKSFTGQAGLFNLYSDIDFLDKCNCRLEYVYNAVFSESSPHALHFEAAKRFSSKSYQLPIVKGHVHILPTIVGGYERGYRAFKEVVYERGDEMLTMSKDEQRNLFGALKLETWKHRIVLVGGAQWSLIKNVPGFFFRVGISL